MEKRNTLSYIIGLVFNICGFFVGSNIFIQFFSKLFSLNSEYKSYLIWCLSGLLISWIGNIIGILIVDFRNVINTIIGSIIGLIIGLALSFIPLFYFLGMITIFLGSMIGHSKNRSSNTLPTKSE